MGTFDVTLPATQPIEFPPRCVACEAPDPDDAVQLSFLGVLTPLKETDNVALDAAAALAYSGNKLDRIAGVPVCKRCASRLKRYHWLLKAGYYVMPVCGLLPLVFSNWSRFLSFPFLILCAVSPGVFTLLVPPSFGATFFGGKANYEFRSKKVADEFLQLNERDSPPVES